MYYAHTREEGEWQTLKEHLTNTAEIASEFALPGLKESAKFMGLLHDLGKYSDEFQRRLTDEGIRVDHSTYGAKAAVKLIGEYKTLGEIAADVIAGHHSGLPDLGTSGENENAGVLRERLKKDCPDASAWQTEIEVDPQVFIKEMQEFSTRIGRFDKSDIAFLTRYFFSCITDADSLDAERFCTGKSRKSCVPDWRKYIEKLDAYLLGKSAETELQRARKTLQDQAKANISADKGIYLLDMPTGSGKTLCSMRLALERAAKTSKKRIIYVIPYTSIVEQTAQEFKNIFDDLPILEHHSEFDFNEDLAEGEKAWDLLRADDSDAKIGEIMKQHSENWDAPLIVTTNVQFFESIYSNKRSKLRKLHNMADSVIVFDEMHTLPIKFFAPCINAIKQLTAKYSAEAIFLTATMPDFAGLAKMVGEELDVFDLIPDKTEYAKFDKCRFEFIGKQDFVPDIDGSESVLVVANTKKRTEELFDACTVPNKFCLSTYLTPADRSRKIATIREMLASDRPDRPVVFSTSLIEAGVDLDFDRVYRELIGPDGILQAAGRCNRNGRRSKAESIVSVFERDRAKSHEMASKQEIALGLIEDYGIEDIGSGYCMRKYFNALYKDMKNAMEMTKQAEKKDHDYFRQFKSIAERFNLIDSSQVGIVIPCDEIRELLGCEFLDGAALKKLRRYAASVSIGEFRKMSEAGLVEDRGNGVFVLADENRYCYEKGGLRTGEEEGQGLFF